MRSIAITGGLATGKTTLLFYLKGIKYKIFDADLVVHSILKNNKSIFRKIKKHFPGCIINDEISRLKLGNEVFFNNNKKCFF